ncbi:MAG TPA: PEP-CTERM sorting domain-containing protein [Gemmataceae bacterium]|nr:PEP-CTERM sorting domain-containing protein [Gemmataceae bacterium]
MLISEKVNGTITGQGYLPDNGSVTINGYTFTDLNPAVGVIRTATTAGSFDNYLFTVSTANNAHTQVPPNQPAVLTMSGTLTNTQSPADTNKYSISFQSQELNFVSPGTKGSNTPVFLTTTAGLTGSSGNSKISINSNSMGAHTPQIVLTPTTPGPMTSQVGPFPEGNNNPPFAIVQNDADIVLTPGGSVSYNSKSVVSLHPPVAVPEPGTLLLAGLGVPFLFGFGLLRRRRKQLA